MKMEETECFETSAYKIQTLGNYPEENVQHRHYVISRKSRILDSFVVLTPSLVLTQYLVF